MPLKTRELTDDADRVLILKNPKAGAGPSRQLLDAVVASLEQRGLTVDLYSDLDHLSDQAERLAETGELRTVLAAGGDGTAEIVVNRIPAEVPLSIFPLGTENLLAKYLGISADPEKVADMVSAGRVAQLDLGAFTTGDSTHLFLLMLGCGFDAEVVRRLHQERTGHINHWSWIKPIFDAVRSYEYPPLRVLCRETRDGPLVADITAHWVFVFNTPSYAVGIEICPGAKPYDGRLDVTTFEGGSFWHGIFHLSSIFVGQHQSLAGVQTVKSRCLRIEAEQSVPFQVDGDPGGLLPVDIEVLPGRLTMIVPHRWIEDCEGGKEDAS